MMSDGVHSIPEAALETERHGIRVTVDREGLEAWDDIVECSPMGTVFHRLAALETIAAHADATLYPLVGYKGQELVGIFPVFELQRGPFTTVFSPPPGMGLMVLGPALVEQPEMKTRRTEKRTRRFLEAAVEWVERGLNSRFTYLRTHPAFPDHRPFGWMGFDVMPRYTYVVDLRPGREVLSSFSSDARRNVKNDDAVTIRESAGGDVDRIVDHLDRRHAEQEMAFPVSAAFARDLRDALPDDAFRTYVCTADGEYVSGMLTLADERTVYRWQGGARPTRDVDAPVNDLLDWRIITDAIDQGKTRYDMFGANTKGLCEYKSKFGPDLVTYQALERGSRTMQFVSGLYQHFR